MLARQACIACWIWMGRAHLHSPSVTNPCTSLRARLLTSVHACIDEVECRREGRHDVLLRPVSDWQLQVLEVLRVAGLQLNANLCVCAAAAHGKQVV